MRNTILLRLLHAGITHLMDQLRHLPQDRIISFVLGFIAGVSFTVSITVVIVLFLGEDHLDNEPRPSITSSQVAGEQIVEIDGKRIRIVPPSQLPPKK